MPKHAKIEFIASEKSITEPVTKFGGQPVWLTEPQWPISRSTGEPMQFIGQIALDDALWPGTTGKMAYIFMTDDEEGGLETWEAEGGENAVIIQPSSAKPSVDVAAHAPDAPVLCRWEDDGKRRVPKACEYAVQLTMDDEPVLGEDWDRDNEALRELHADMIECSKIGGNPFFLQNDEYPESGKWNLLLQLDSATVPFEVNFGDAGVGYAFMDEKGECGRFLWQCC